MSYAAQRFSEDNRMLGGHGLGLHATRSHRLYVPIYDVIVCIVQRAASTSMSRALRTTKPRFSQPINEEDALTKRNAGTRVILWLRNPEARFISTIRIFQRGGKDLDTFMNRLINEPNIHWSSQIEMHTYLGTFLPTQVYRFDDLAATWAMEFPDTPLGWERRDATKKGWDQVKTKLSQKALASWKSFYAEDLALYNSLS